jgi:putative transposase
MSLKYNKKIEVEFSEKDEHILDGQSKICNWLYNRLLEECQNDYKNNNNEKKLLDGRNLRDYGVTLKDEHPFLNTVFSSVLKEPSTRLKLAYEKFFAGDAGYPKYRSQKKKWFSLVFDEPNKGWEVKNGYVYVSLGNIPDMPKEKGKKNPSVKGKLKEELKLVDGELLKTFSLVKQQGKFYAIFNVEKCSKKELKYKEDMTKYRKECNLAKKNNQEPPEKPVLEEEEVVIPKDCKWIALDPNHKNFFVGVDYKGDSIEFEKLKMVKYWDKVIDKLKSKRDKCQKNYKKRKTENGSTYTVHSPRWNRINHALNIAYSKRREQIKTALYSISGMLYSEYDLVIIGDYTPTNGTAPFKNMKRSMLNQEHIGKFRKTLEWVAKREDKFYIIANERNTTKDCCVCGHQEKKAPDVRKFTCQNCGTTILRDSNSAVNIGKKAEYFLDIEKHKDRLDTLTYKGVALYGRKATKRKLKKSKSNKDISTINAKDLNESKVSN